MWEDIAKHLGRPLDTACTLIENMLGVPSKRIGDLMGDQISYWWWSNRLRIAERCAAKLKERGIAIRALPLDFAVPFLRECGNTENPDLQEWWAELLTSAIGDESYSHVAFVHTLQSMSPADVRFLDVMLSSEPVQRDERFEVVAKASGLSIQHAKVSFFNLERLGFFSVGGSKLKGFAFVFLAACYPHPDRIATYKTKQSKLGGHLLVE